MSLNASSEDTPVTVYFPPENFPLIALHIALQHQPATPFSLSLTAKGIYACVYPALCPNVIIKNEEHACRILDQIPTDISNV